MLQAKYSAGARAIDCPGVEEALVATNVKAAVRLPSIAGGTV